jgi:riboflavin kinase/FMN adenylyltransferase
MELIRGLHNLRPRHRDCVATIGAFDGVHLGHQAVIRELLDRSAVMAVPAVVIVFEPLPREYFSPLAAPARLMSFREKLSALESLGVDRVLGIRFDERVRSMSARAFIERVFVDGLGARFVVLGDDFRFGNDREGDLTLVQQEGRRLGFEAAPTTTLAAGGQRVSSTRIREALAAADFELAEVLLGRPYSMAGKVVYGKQMGRTIGTPTANLRLQRLRSPLAGVFVVEVTGAGLQGAPGVANVGTRPTLENSIEANLEVHLLDREVALYGRYIEVTFRAKLRDEIKFSGLEDLRAHIARDIESTRAWFASR